MKKTTPFLSVAILLILGTVLLYAQPEQNKDVDIKMQGDKKVIKIRKGGDFFVQEQLNLTQDQKKEFKKLDLALEKDIISSKNELEVTQLELEVALEENEPRLNKINSLIDKIHNLEAEIEKKRIANEFKKRDLLTDEQKEKWRPRRPSINKEIIMFKGDRPRNLLWFDEHDLPVPPKIEREIEIIEK